MSPDQPLKPLDLAEPTVSAAELDQSLDSAPATQVVTKSKKSRLVIILASLLVATTSGVGAFKVLRSSPQPDVITLRSNSAGVKPTEIKDPVEVAKEFIKGLQTGDKQRVDNLLGTSFKAAVKADTGNESYYDGCKAAPGCLESYAAFDLSSARSQLINESKESPQGKTVALAATVMRDGKTLDVEYDIHVSPNGKSWLIEDIVDASSSSN